MDLIEICPSQLLKGKGLVVNDKISIRQPLLDEVSELTENRYYSMISGFTSTPDDYKVALYDMGINYDEITDFELFFLISKNLKLEDTKILFGDLDFSKFITIKNPESDQIILYDPVNDIVIDELIYNIITEFIRKMHGITKSRRNPANKMSRKYFIEKERNRLLRKKREEKSAILEPLVVALVNCPHFKYDYETVWGLHMYKFTRSLSSIQKQKAYDQLMQGAYAGTVELKSINKEEINWLN